MNLAEKEFIEQSLSNEHTDKKSKRKYDIIVFGASGFTGQFIVMEMGYFSQKYNLTWAVAGRNTNKLQNVLDNMYKVQNGFGNKKIDIIYADVQDNKSVRNIALATSVIINCVGPYYIYGHVIVKSCVMNSTHYVDVTGESLFMEKMAYLYNNYAETNGSVIVSALGMESVPADLGVEFLYKNFNGTLQNVDSYMKLYSSSYALFSSAMIHDGTWTSAILHLATRKQRLHYRKLLDESLGITRIEPKMSKLLHKQQLSTHNNKYDWCLSFPEPDEAIITRSIHHAKHVDNLPYNFQVRTYLVFGGLITSIISLCIIILLYLMAALEPIRILLVRFPKFFSFGFATKTGPTEKVMKNSRMSLTIIGRGLTSVQPLSFNGKVINGQTQNNTRTTIVKVKAKNPGYGFTAKAVVLGAITILKDEFVPKGGVITPASAFRNTKYLELLIEHEAATFEIESDLVVYRPYEKQI